MANITNQINLTNNSKFLARQIARLPHYFKQYYSFHEIQSEMVIIIAQCCKGFNPKKGTISNFVNKTALKVFKQKIAEIILTRKTERPLEFAQNVTYAFQDPSEVRLSRFLKSLPNALVDDLTEYTEGQKEKGAILRTPYVGIGLIDLNKLMRKIDDLLV